MKVNRLPSSTWRWLKVNESDMEVPKTAARIRPECTIPDVILTDRLPEIDTKGGLGEEFDNWIRQSGIEAECFSVSGDTVVDVPVYMDYKKAVCVAADENADDIGKRNSVDETHGDVDCYVNRNAFALAKNSSLDVIQLINLSYRMPAGFKADGRFIISNRYDLKEGSRLKIVQVIYSDSRPELVNDNGGICADGASFELIQVVLGGGVAKMGDFCRLEGTKSSYRLDLAYYLKGENTLDMNYVADHKGRRSLSEMNISGVMADSSSKIFRGTIDFHKGCAQAKGSELEEVLLMNEGVVNKTVPLILCDEEDVEGNHGASIGRLDDNLIFYLASRGMDDEEIYKMMARARIDRVASRITDKMTTEMISDILGDNTPDD